MYESFWFYFITEQQMHNLYLRARLDVFTYWLQRLYRIISMYVVLVSFYAQKMVVNKKFRCLFDIYREVGEFCQTKGTWKRFYIIFSTLSCSISITSSSSRDIWMCAGSGTPAPLVYTPSSWFTWWLRIKWVWFHWFLGFLAAEFVVYTGEFGKFGLNFEDWCT